VCGSQYTGTPEHLVPFRAKAVENSDSWCPWLSRASTKYAIARGAEGSRTPDL